MKRGQGGRPQFRSPTIAALFAEVERSPGWRWRYGHHLMVYPPGGQEIIVISTTAYDSTVTKRIESQLRKAGLGKGDKP